MEAYQLLLTVAEGPCGPTLLVRRTKSGERCVIKKVECRDYTQALRAYNQALELEQLSGCPSLIHYRNFFVHWEQEAQAIYLCIVSDYYEQGDLQTAINHQRDKREHFEESTIRKWVGNMVEALSHAHQCGLRHRNLKPSNLYLSSSPSPFFFLPSPSSSTSSLTPSLPSLLVGDFSVPVALANLRKIVERRGGTLQWLSPEVLAKGGKRGRGGGNREGGKEEEEEEGEEEEEEKCDIWSLGCVLLELLTCGSLDGVGFSVLLYQLQRDPGTLETVVTEAGKTFSKELCQLLEACLRRSVEQRPSVRDLVKLPIVQSCLELINSALYAAPIIPGNTDGPVSKVGKQAGEGYKYIVAAMKANPNDKQLLIHYSCLLWSALIDDNCSEVMGESVMWEGVVGEVCHSMAAHPRDATLCNVCCSLLWRLSLQEQCSVEMLKCGVIDLLLKAMHTHQEDHEVVKYVCLCLSSLAGRCEECAYHIIQSESRTEGIPIIMNAIDSGRARETMAAIVQLLQTLTEYDDIRKELEILGATKTLALWQSELQAQQVRVVGKSASTDLSLKKPPQPPCPTSHLVTSTPPPRCDPPC